MKLVKSTLHNLIERFQFFFADNPDTDTNSKDTNPVLLTKVLTSLHVKIFNDYSCIIKPGQQPKDVYFIDSGLVNIIDNTGLFIIAELNNSSFFGEH